MRGFRDSLGDDPLDFRQFIHQVLLSLQTAGRIDDAERLEKIHAALSTLRRTERDVLALCVWSGLNYAEAAEALGVPVGTVRSRLSRARRRLQRKLPREPGPASEQVTGDRVGGTR